MFSSSVYDRVSICEDLDGSDHEDGEDKFSKTSTTSLINRDVISQKT